MLDRTVKKRPKKVVRPRVATLNQLLSKKKGRSLRGYCLVAGVGFKAKSKETTASFFE